MSQSLTTGQSQGLYAGGLIGLTAVDIYSRTRANNAVASYRSSVARGNAKLANLSAESARIAGEMDVQDSNRRTAALVGKARSSYGGQGVDPNSGSAMKVQQSIDAMGALSAMTIRNNAMRQAWGYKVQGANYMSEARYAGVNADAENAQTFLTGGMRVFEGGYDAGLFGRRPGGKG